MIDIANALYWVAAPTVGVALLFEIFGRVAAGRTLRNLGLIATSTGFALLTVSIGLRWVELGHGPYLATYEAASSYTWALLGLYLLLRLRFRQLANAGPFVIAPALLLLGLGVTSDPGPRFESPAMHSVWLWIHVGAVKVSLASLIVGGVIAIRSVGLVHVPLMGPAQAKRQGGNNERASDRIYELSFNLVAAGFFLLAVVIGSGALWARSAWGAYWTWDPIESWALATWVIYGIVIHAQRMWNVRLSVWVRLNLIALTVSAVLFVGLRFLSQSPHWIYSG